MSFEITPLLEKAVAGERLTPDDGVRLLESHDLIAIGQAADAVTRRLHPEPYRTYNIDRNINYTNVCKEFCTFCAFYRVKGDSEAYVLPDHVIYKKIEETLSLGGTGILMQGGVHPDLKIDYYEALFGHIKEKYPKLWLHALSPPEIVHIRKVSRISLAETLARLKAAGLDSIPGGGAEILVDDVREQIGRAHV